MFVSLLKLKLFVKALVLWLTAMLNLVFTFFVGQYAQYYKKLDSLRLWRIDQLEQDVLFYKQQYEFITNLSFSLFTISAALLIYTLFFERINTLIDWVIKKGKSWLKKM